MFWAVFVGLMMTSRPVFFMVAPIVIKLMGIKRSLVSLFIFFLSMAAYYPIPYFRFGTNTSALMASVVMFCLSLIVTWKVSNKENLIFSIGCILLLPSFISSTNALHTILAIPFLMIGVKNESTNPL